MRSVVTLDACCKCLQLLRFTPALLSTVVVLSESIDYDGIVIVCRMHSIDAVTNPTLQLITPTSIYNVCTIDCGKHHSARLDSTIVALVLLAASKQR